MAPNRRRKNVDFWGEWKTTFGGDFFATVLVKLMVLNRCKLQNVQLEIGCLQTHFVITFQFKESLYNIWIITPVKCFLLKLRTVFQEKLLTEGESTC